MSLKQENTTNDNNDNGGEKHPENEDSKMKKVMAGGTGKNELVQTSKELKYLDGLPYTTFNGIKYVCHYKYNVVYEFLPILRNLSLRDDDVWMISYPKSGNHWTFEILTMVLKQDTQFSKRMFIEHATEYLGSDVQNIIDGYESPRVLALHIAKPECYPKEIVERQLKIVYLIRNPKDVSVSHYHMWTGFSEPECHYSASFSEYFNLQIKGEFIHGDWFDHVLAFEKFMKDHPEQPVYALSYERMKEDPVSIIKELCSFCGKPTDLAEDIARVTQFSNMKKVLDTGKMKEYNDQYIAPTAEGFLRKGVVGDWRTFLTAVQSAEMDRVFQVKMSGSKLAEKVAKYM